MIFFVALFIGNSKFSNAQCVIINDPNAEPGFTPAANTQPCFVRNQNGNITIQMKNFGTITNDVFVISTRVDSVLNLPAGLTWTFEVPAGNNANTLLANENGCLNITGTTTDAAATYDIDLFVTVEVSLSGQVNTVNGKGSELQDLFQSTFGFAIDLSYFVKVVETPANCDNIVSVKDLKTVSELSVYPNPAVNAATIALNSSISEKLNFQLFDLLGRKVWTRETQIETGSNIVTINPELSLKGVYFLSVSNGKEATVRRLVFN